jgi:hypothetical protein
MASLEGEDCSTMTKKMTLAILVIINGAATPPPLLSLKIWPAKRPGLHPVTLR